METKEGTIVNVKAMVEEKKKNLKLEVSKLKEKGVIPKLAVILANNEEASRIYVGKKRDMCKELGVEQVEYMLDEKVTNEEFIDIIQRLNNDTTIDGILVQLPIFKHLDEKRILETISAKKDVDGFHPLNLGKLLIGNEDVIACTPKGIMNIIENLGIEIEGKTAVVVGRSIIVGKPISMLLLNKDATVITCHSKTKNLKKYTKMADILVVAAGVPHLITEDMVKSGSTIIDVGINRINGKVVGDVDSSNVVKKAKYVTPVPGGVGITTVVSLLDNLIEIAKGRLNN